ncbi:hypothetical protein [Mycobacterium sp. EPa45]|nr:hypothetical protein [Mycobacterium sp. EPa45]
MTLASVADAQDVIDAAAAAFPQWRDNLGHQRGSRRRPDRR